MGNNPALFAGYWNPREFCDELCLLEDTMDWGGYISPVKDQGYGCGSSWAFATNGVLELNYARMNVGEKTITLSEQQLVDCSTHDKGCDDGFFGNAVLYAYDNKIEKTEDYPYTGVAGECAYDDKKGAVWVGEL